MLYFIYYTDWTGAIVLSINWFWNIIYKYYIPVLLYGVGGYIVLKALYVLFLKRHFRFLFRFVISAAFLLYAIILVYVTLVRYPHPTPQYELSFLWEYRLALAGDDAWKKQILNNIVAFLPLGIFFGEFSEWRQGGRGGSKWYIAMAAGFSTSLVIETIQLVFKLGLFELDDLLNNTIGMMAGFFIYRLVCLIKD